MSFRTNLQYLRSRRNLTQERLAMLLGVSRQAVSKWESEKAYPEMDKLLMICDLFGCTLDDLVMGDVRRPSVDLSSGAVRPDAVSGASFSADGAPNRNVVGFASMEASDGVSDGVTSDVSSAASVTSPDGPFAEPAGSSAGTSMSSAPSSASSVGPLPDAPSKSANAQDVTGYDAHRRSFARLVAIGVMAIIAGVGLAALFDGDASMLGRSPWNDPLSFVCIAVGVVAGLACIVPAAMGHAAFRRAHPYVEDFYTVHDHERSGRRLAVSIVIGVAFIMAGVGVVTWADGVLGQGDGWPTLVMLLACACGVGLFVWAGIGHGMLNVDDYNKEAEEERLEREGKVDFRKRLTGVVCGVIMLVATIVGLWMLFAGAVGPDGRVDWDGYGDMASTQLFWMPWMIGGLLCGVAALVIQMFGPRDDR